MSELIPYSQQSSEVAPTGVGALVAMVSQLEGQLGAACPLAVSRLQGIADMTALSLAEVVSDAAQKLGR